MVVPSQIKRPYQADTPPCFAISEVCFDTVPRHQQLSPHDTHYGEAFLPTTQDGGGTISSRHLLQLVTIGGSCPICTLEVCLVQRANFLLVLVRLLIFSIVVVIVVVVAFVAQHVDLAGRRVAVKVSPPLLLVVAFVFILELIFVLVLVLVLVLLFIVFVVIEVVQPLRSQAYWNFLLRAIDEDNHVVIVLRLICVLGAAVRPPLLVGQRQTHIEAQGLISASVNGNALTDDAIIFQVRLFTAVWKRETRGDGPAILHDPSPILRPPAHEVRRQVPASFVPDEGALGSCAAAR
mmetsp:Transcript_149479/g.380064  ORF Transcript_149479/g.380064 Transcript_149479/m.380064 type:complete len:293 (-) Transcript_149479:460-1338(-)